VSRSWWASPSVVLAFSYWIDYLGLITERKLAAIFIKPSLGVSNWLVIYYTFPHQLDNRSFLPPLPRLKNKLPHHHHRAINHPDGQFHLLNSSYS
jgi:hypothetical protein